MRPSPSVASIDIPLAPAGDVRVGEVEGRVEECADREQQVRLAGARLADERADRARPHDERPRGAEVGDADLAEERLAHRYRRVTVMPLNAPWKVRCAGSESSGSTAPSSTSACVDALGVDDHQLAAPVGRRQMDRAEANRGVGERVAVLLQETLRVGAVGLGLAVQHRSSPRTRACRRRSPGRRSRQPGPRSGTRRCSWAGSARTAPSRGSRPPCPGPARRTDAARRRRCRAGPSAARRRTCTRRRT